jgi:hypothetical protein
MRIKNKNAIVIFIMSMLMIYYNKPWLLFIKEVNGGYNIREHGFGYDNNRNKKTLFDMQKIIIIVAVFSFILGEKLMKSK